MRKIAGVLFDLDNTLIDFSSAENYAEDLLFERLSKKHNTNKELLKRLFLQVKHKHRKINQTPKDNSRKIWFKEMFELLGIEEDCSALEREYWELLNNKVEMFPGAKEILKYCKEKGLKVGIITDSDGEPEFKDERIRKFEFHKLVDFILKSDDVGYNKPNIKMFERALELLGIEKENAKEVMIVGDDPPLDLEVPHKMGMITIWKTKKAKLFGLEKPKFIDHVIEKLEEIKEILKNYIDTTEG